MSFATTRLAIEKGIISTPLVVASFCGEDKEKSMAYVPYQEQIKNPKWQKKRLEVLNHVGFRCEHCDCEDKQLHVHHKHYKKGKMIWEYDNDDLVVLCSDCHKRIHELKDKLKSTIDSADIHLLNLMAGLLSALEIDIGDLSTDKFARQIGNLAFSALTFLDEESTRILDELIYTGSLTAKQLIDFNKQQEK